MTWSFIYNHLLTLLQAAGLVIPFLLLERLFPAERHPLRSLVFNAVYAVTAYIVIAAHSQIYTWLAAAVIPWRTATLDLPPLFTTDLSGWELAGRFVVYLAVVDFLAYWRHR